jgi:hypothetical protein
MIEDMTCRRHACDHHREQARPDQRDERIRALSADIAAR